MEELVSASYLECAAAPGSRAGLGAAGQGVGGSAGHGAHLLLLLLGEASATRGPLLPNAGALHGTTVIIIALKQSTESLLLWRDH